MATPQFALQGVLLRRWRAAKLLTAGETSPIMSTLKEFKCEICGTVSANPIHWFVIECGDSKLSVHKWDLEVASRPTARHFCGEAHAQIFISRWFDSVCVPPKR